MVLRLIDGQLVEVAWNSTEVRPSDVGPVWEWDDVTWILTASFVIYTMQTGFGLLGRAPSLSVACSCKLEHLD